MMLFAPLTAGSTSSASELGSATATGDAVCITYVDPSIALSIELSSFKSALTNSTYASCSGVKNSLSGPILISF